MYRRAILGLGYLPQETSIFRGLTVEQNISAVLELANDTWRGGAENHDASEGDWAVRKAASEKAYREWLPVSDDYYASYEVGNLATLFRLETRHTARDKPFELDEVFDAAAPGKAEAALAAFRDGAWRDPARGLLEADAEQLSALVTTTV